MANPTSNFGWQMPTNTDLVKDLPADFEVFGQAVDTSLMDLKGGTTGQILSKASNTDMDFTWIANDQGDITAVTAGTGISGGGTSGAVTITNSMATAIDAKADLIVGTGSDTFTRLAGGNSGDELLVDSSTTTGLRWQGNYAAGKNKIINGDFAINQRAFTSTTTSNTYGFDRFALAATDGTVTYSAQTFTLGSAPVAGYEAINFAQIVTSGQTLTSAVANLFQKIEDVRTFAGQTITVSFWAKAASGTPNIAVNCVQNFGTGGSPSASVNTSSATQAISTSWARYSFTLAIPSVSGKTIGTTAGTNFFGVQIWFSGGTATVNPGSIGIQSGTFQIWGVQVEAGNVATSFQTATGTLQGELALCQRYYYKLTAVGSGRRWGTGFNSSTTSAVIFIPFQVTMRTPPTALEQSGTAGDYTIAYEASTATLTSVPAFSSATEFGGVITGGTTGLTAGQGVMIRTANSSAYLAWSAEL